MATEPWIAVSRRINLSPLVAKGADALGCTRNEMVGALVGVWSTVADLGRDGALHGVPDSVLERWADWQGTVGAFATFLRAHHCDRHGRVKDWADWNGQEGREKRMAQRRMDRHRSRVAQSVASSNGESLQPATAERSGSNGASVTTDRQTDVTDRQTEGAREARQEPPQIATRKGDVLEGWKQRRDQAAVDAQLCASIKRKVATESGGPLTFPTNSWSQFTADERDAIKRLGGLVAIWGAER